MTGNNKVWRASLAGLASVAMLATMGVVSGTANAADASEYVDEADFSVTFKNGDTPVAKYDKGNKTVVKGESLVDLLDGYANVPVATEPNKVFLGWYDGDSPVDYTAPLTGDKTYTAKFADAADGSVEVVYPVTAEFQYVGNQSTVYVAYGSTVNASQLPIDKAGDGKLVKTWKITVSEDGGDTKDFAEGVTTADLPAKLSSTRPKNTVYTVTPETWEENVKTVTFEGVNHYSALNEAGDGKLDDLGLTVDVVAGQTVTAPKFVAYQGANAKSVPSTWFNGKSTYVAPDAATPAVNDDVKFTPAKNTTLHTVNFHSNGGSKVDSVKVADGQTVAEPATPTKEGYTFKGWTTDAAGKYAFDFAGTAINADTDLYAQWYLSSAITVTFKDAPANANPNKTVEVKIDGNEYLTADQVPDFTREGYLFVGWVQEGTTKAALSENALTKQLAKQLNDGYDVTYVAEWEKASANTAAAALNYITAADADLFTDASWNEYKPVLEQAKKDYDKTKYESVEVSDAASAQIVTSLNAAWQKLVFKTGSADTTPAYRFYNHVTNEHLFTTDPREASILKVNPDWNYENVAFNILKEEKDAQYKKLASFDAAVDAVFKNDDAKAADIKAQLDAAADPVTVEVSRLYNRVTNEHLFTTNPAEVDTLVAGDWGYESSFYAPVFSSNKSVYRLYNPILNQHLFTQNQAEVDKTTTEDWVLEGIEFKAL